MSFNPDCYEVLGIGSTATQIDIKRAYRKQAFQFHPDRNPGNPDAEQKTKAINAAYDILKNPKKRLQYDRSRATYASAAAGDEMSSPPPRRSNYYANFGEWLWYEAINIGADVWQNVAPTRWNFIWLFVLALTVDYAYNANLDSVFGAHTIDNAHLIILFAGMHLIFFLFWLLFYNRWHWFFLSLFIITMLPLFNGKPRLSGWLLFVLQFSIALALWYKSRLIYDFIIFYQPLFTIAPLKPLL